MASFKDILRSVDQNKLKSFLSSQNQPSFESALLKVAFENINVRNEEPLSLYRYHFVLFHILYKLQHDYYKENKYLHVHFMRTFLTDYPDINKCRFYDEYSGIFCSKSIIENDNYCEFHIKQMGETNIDLLSLKYFYSNEDNYSKITKKMADDLVNGSWEVLSKYDDYKNSFKILELPESSSLATIKKQFKYLAKKYHPDIKNLDTFSELSSKSFNEINNAYRLLVRINTLNEKII